MHRSKKGVSRRQLLTGGAAAAGSIALTGLVGAASADDMAGMDMAATTTPTRLKALSQPEAAIVGAMADRVFPRDGDSPSATEIGVVTYLDGQLAGGWGSGERFYRQGPFREPESSGHGYQLSLTPRDVYRNVLPKIDAHAKSTHNGTGFVDLDPKDQDAILTDLQNGKVDLDLASGPNGFTSASFFTMFLQNVTEGLFSDPAYGGNKDLAGWKWIDYPGDPMAYGDDYYAIFGHRGDDYEVPPKAMADGMGG
ncbi:MAG TPA: gluconate 2-dehydrogenase subunit 3 family protein [Baekduia sp.]|jgi:gluconate 2-dehydrogenase gamma chain